MQKVFDLIIEKIKEEKASYFLTIANTGDEKLDSIYKAVANAIDRDIEIVNQVAEEYLAKNRDKSRDSNEITAHYGCNTNGEHEKCDDCGVADKCPDYKKQLFEMNKSIEQKEVGISKMETTSDGWIPCEQRLPNEFDYPEQNYRVLASCTDGIVRNTTIKSLLENTEHYNHGEIFFYVAWQPLPEPYQPKKDCNNCANYTEPDEVDNGCYMCCKGLENNYQPKSKQKIANPISPEQLEQLHKNIRNI